MAFQTGSKINPRLGALDYSGYTNAAAIQAKGIQDLGKQISSAIQEYAQEKKKKAETEETKQLLIGQGIPEEDANLISKRPGIAPSVLKYAGMVKNQEALDKAIAANTYIGGDVDWKMVPQTARQAGATNIPEIMQMANQANEQKYKELLMSIDLKDKEIIRNAVSRLVEEKEPGWIRINPIESKEQALSYFTAEGGTDVATAAKVFDGLVQQDIRVEDIAGTDYVGLKQGKKVTQVLPKSKPKEQEKLTAFEQNMEARMGLAKELYSALESGDENRANEILFALGERSPEGLPLTAERLKQGNSLNLFGAQQESGGTGVDRKQELLNKYK